MTTTRLTFPLYGLGLEWHHPVTRPYPGAPGFVLTHCRVCDGRRERVQLDTEEPATCRVWREALNMGAAS